MILRKNVGVFVMIDVLNKGIGLFVVLGELFGYGLSFLTISQIVGLCFLFRVGLGE